MYVCGHIDCGVSYISYRDCGGISKEQKGRSGNKLKSLHWLERQDQCNVNYTNLFNVN